MRCYRCGNDHVEGSSICFKCGANLQNKDMNIIDTTKYQNINNNTNIANTSIANTIINATSSNVDDEMCIDDTVSSYLFNINKLRNRKIRGIIENKEKFLEKNHIYLSIYSKVALYTIAFFIAVFLVVLVLKVKLLDFLIWVIPCLYYINIALSNSINGIVIGVKSCMLTKSSESMRCIIYNLLVNLVFVFYLFSLDYIVE